MYILPIPSKIFTAQWDQFEVSSLLGPLIALNWAGRSGRIVEAADLSFEE